MGRLKRVLHDETNWTRTVAISGREEELTCAFSLVYTRPLPFDLNLMSVFRYTRKVGVHHVGYIYRRGFRSVVFAGKFVFDTCFKFFFSFTDRFSVCHISLFERVGQFFFFFCPMMYVFHLARSMPDHESHLSLLLPMSEFNTRLGWCRTTQIGRLKRLSTTRRCGEESKRYLCDVWRSIIAAVRQKNGFSVATSPFTSPLFPPFALIHPRFPTRSPFHPKLASPLKSARVTALNRFFFYINVFS